MYKVKVYNQTLGSALVFKQNRMIFIINGGSKGKNIMQGGINEAIKIIIAYPGF